jgi:hypothetical protein
LLQAVTATCPTRKGANGAVKGEMVVSALVVAIAVMEGEVVFAFA